MNDTPRTDEQINGKPCTRFAISAGDSLRDAHVPSEFARQLERELTVAQTVIEREREQNARLTKERDTERRRADDNWDHFNNLAAAAEAENSRLRALIAEAQKDGARTTQLEKGARLLLESLELSHYDPAKITERAGFNLSRLKYESAIDIFRAMSAAPQLPAVDSTTEGGK